MRFVDEFRDAEKARALSAKIASLCEPGRQYKFMEVCGGHTHTIYKHGLEDYLPEAITLVHGPGCPVCVIPMGRVDDAIHLASQPDTIMTSFGDMMRVPGSHGSFFDAKAAGTDIRMVYSPLDSLKTARQNPGKRVVFMAIGFETTTPSTAMTVLRARAEGLENFSVFCNHVTIIPAIKAILDSPDLRLDGFIGPGHVSTVIGCRPYEFIAKSYGMPVRRGAQGRAQALGVQGVRHRVHPGNPHRHVHGVAGRRLRRVLQLRPAEPAASPRGDLDRAEQAMTQQLASTPPPRPRRVLPTGDREQQVLDRIERARRRRPKLREERITMSHGAGGKATHTLIEAIFLEAFRNPLLEPLEDAARLPVPGDGVKGDGVKGDGGTATV